jgi:NADH-quinone oxidoreductase subunit M
VIFDSLSITSAIFFAALTAINLLARPKRDREPRQTYAFLCIAAGTLLAYFADNLPLFALGWVITIIPYWTGWLHPGPRWPLAAGAASLVLGTVLFSTGSPDARMAAFVTLTLAALIRKGIFPFHFWVRQAFTEGELLPIGLLLNGHLGAVLLIRFVIPGLPDIAAQALPLLSMLALGTSLYMAVMALAEPSPRRILALLCLSQASFILAGLENRNVEGIAGALLHWFVVAAATTGLLCAYRSLEARIPQVSSPTGFLGLGSRAPRLAVFFALSGLALIGLPGTLGFAAEDLLFHGSLEAHPLLGFTLPLATAFNGITVYRLFSKLFLGRAERSTPVIPDVLPRERWALALVVVFLVVAGILPRPLIDLREPAAEHLAGVLGTQ